MDIKYNSKKIEFEEINSLSPSGLYNLNIRKHNFAVEYTRISFGNLIHFLDKTKSKLEKSLINITDTK